jgi:hypothetical protein
VKFVDDQDPGGLEDDELTKGRYLTARYVDQLLTTKHEGRKGGDSHYIARGRSIDSSTFVHLVRDGWIGSRGSVTAALKGLLSSPSAELTLAVDQPQ